MNFLISLITFLCLFGGTALAQDKQDLLNEIDQLTKDIRSELFQSSADENSLLEIRDSLQDILALLENDGNPSDTSCFDFAYEKYYISMGSKESTDAAFNACKKIKDVKVSKYAYEKYYISMGSKDSMDRARDMAAGDVKGKLPIIEFAYEKYYISMGSKESMDSAIKKSYLVNKNSLSCISKAYEKYYMSMGSVDSINKAFEACKN